MVTKMSVPMVTPSFKFIEPEKRPALVVGLIREMTNIKDPIVAIDLIRETIRKYDEEAEEEVKNNADRPV